MSSFFFLPPPCYSLFPLLFPTGGSCWAFSSTEVLGDRYCIGGGSPVVLSPEYVLECDTMDDGCNGGNLDTVWKFLTKTGTVQDSCDPYISGGGNVPSTCPSKCSDGSKPTFYKAKDAQQITGVSSIQNAIMTDGPVQAAFSVYQDFFSYTGGVYVHTSGGLVGGHAIKIIGWGVDSTTNQPYWLVANSWGTSWGLQGFFWILRGADECGIEDGMDFKSRKRNRKMCFIPSLLTFNSPLSLSLSPSKRRCLGRTLRLQLNLLRFSQNSSFSNNNSKKKKTCFIIIIIIINVSLEEESLRIKLFIPNCLL